MPKLPPVSRDFALLEAFWRRPCVRQVLPNGLTLLIQPDHAAPVASVQVWVKTGSLHEDQFIGAGLSHYLEHMLFKGTARWVGREISATVQTHGGNINAYTTFDRTVYYVDLPSEHVGVAIDILADAVLNSTLPAEETARERDVILREIAMGQDDPDQRFFEALFDTAFREHPYRHPIIGHRDVFSAVTREDLVTYYHSRYVPNNLVVVITGDVDPIAVTAEVTKHFGSAPRSRLAPIYIPEEPAQLAPRSLHRFEDVELTRAGLAWPIPGLAHADAPVLDLLGTLLGHGDSSVLWQAIREKARLVHSIDAQSWTPGTAGLFYIFFTCDPAKREKATVAIASELKRVAARGFTSAQMRKALRQLIVGEINSRKTVAGQAARIGAAEVVAGDLEFSRGYFSRLRRVTSVDLTRVLRTYLPETRLTAVSINPPLVKPTQPKPVSGTGAESLFEEIRLPNGARLLLQPNNHLPNLHLRLVCEGGALYEPANGRGATALLANLLTKDTRRRSSEEVARFIEEVGGSFYPFSGNNSFGVAVETLPGDVDRALSVLGDALQAPAFLPKTFEIEREAQLAELKQDADDVVTLGRKLVRRRFFGAYPLAVDPTGEEEGLKRLKPADLAALWRRWRVGGNLVLAVAGDFDRRTLVPKLKALLAKCPRGTLAKPAAAFTGAAEVGDFTERQPREQAVVFQAFAAPGLQGKDFYAGEVTDELFSGMSSRLFERVREEKGLAYFVRSSRVTGRYAGMFYLYAGTAPAQADAVLAEMDAELERVRTGGVTIEELRRCQTRLKAGRRMGLQTNGARAMQAGLDALYGLPANDGLKYGERIDAVTLADVQTFAQRYFQLSGRTQLVVRP